MKERREVAMVIPADRLPAGFAQRIGMETTHPSQPFPAATAVLMRDGATDMEVLLLKRLRSSGFVPGAYVFAGGRVDEEDAAFADSDISSTSMREAPAEPGLEYWVAAIREVFEESGVLLACDETGRSAHAALLQTQLETARDRLMQGAASLQEVLAELALAPDYDAMAYAAHWITPLAETRRFDTRFFYAALPDGAVATADAREMCDAVWLSPSLALERFEAGSLPMVFPTVRTLEELLPFRNVAEAMSFVRRTEIKPIMPSLVRVGDGVGIVLDADDASADK
jgi:8-oxo-dGTP pyrophosphatase MutT (NUDIX family)